MNVKSKFKEIVQWQSNGKRAPHKPLMLLLALGRFSNGIDTFEYRDIEEELTDLLVKFGPSRRTYRPNDPFWRLGKNEGIFELKNWENVKEDEHGSANKADLRERRTSACFNQEIRDALNSNPELVNEIATDLVLTHFQSSYLEDLLESVSLTVADDSDARRRDPRFRERIITAYRSRCAVCEFHLVLGKVAIGLEAAHIMWHNAGGPDSVNNGLALCPIHHKLFDYGVFMIDPEKFKIEVSPRAHAFGAAETYLTDYKGTEIRLPLSRDDHPGSEYLLWHAEEKYKH